ncbi:MAG TPA: alkaline phosphatase family protein [Candidatus Eisenbacteria bacterium]
MIHTRSTGRDAPGPADLIRAGVGGGLVLGLSLARLTWQMNPHLSGHAGDIGLLFLYFAIGYGLAGAAVGAAGALVLGLIRTVAGRTSMITTLLGTAGLAGLLLGPMVYYALLPDVGWQHGFHSGLLFGASRPRLLLSLLGLVAALSVTGWLLRPVVQSLADSLRVSSRTLLVRLVILAGVLIVALGAAFPPRPAEPVVAAPTSLAAITPPDSSRAPVVLLCIDGADLDDMILPMTAKGELPVFAHLMRAGTWGRLATIEPTLSAVVWTTIITGKTPDQHGIRHFIVFRLPGIRKAIHQFPRHTGLNFRIFPMLEKLPGMPSLQAPYTSNMRTAEALWNIAGRFMPVGAYRWLVTWPVEPVNGFNVAGGVGWLQIMGGFENEAHDLLSKGFHYPHEVYAGLPLPTPIPDVTKSMLEPYVGAGHDVPPTDWKVKAIAAALRDPTGHYLPLLQHKFGARFTAASFYPVDEFCHYFAVNKDKGGIYSNAVAERYRYTDARLGEYLAALGDSVNVVIVSDHGYDFVQNHHTNAPAGVFFGIGPDFAAGKRLDTLNVYDVAPLCLELLGLPPGADMPATAPRRYEAALLHGRGTNAPAAVATWETGERRADDPISSPIDAQIKEQLRSLGYIN